MAAPTRLLFVCTGNICRSPSAEGVFRHMAAAAGLAERAAADSCGLASYHVGEAPTRAAQDAASARGYDLSTLRARRFERVDFDRFDLILAMDGGHEAQLRRMARGDQAARIALFLAAAPDAAAHEVPDPYYGGPAKYEYALDLIEAGCRGWIDRLQRA
ncbi:low molecular weight phosphotyrosine protein phosphatase [Marivibrio halodurans]|uniref:protein-tyrosine-phosphatase n=1 Tax=Marivibrio halodurans TaxID=2039722 RepID=A0A8J7V383_9PROT|nr:low molecular weight protein-tyrosine-phosphatase [Marivibrio halodurans]MBP5857951.1 low molecular weight phosphotyrosine protein phosphatase [Marivibrio halodurans]